MFPSSSLSMSSRIHICAPCDSREGPPPRPTHRARLKDAMSSHGKCSVLQRTLLDDSAETSWWAPPSQARLPTAQRGKVQADFECQQWVSILHGETHTDFKQGTSLWGLKFCSWDYYIWMNLALLPRVSSEPLSFGTEPESLFREKPHLAWRQSIQSASHQG